MKDMDKSTWGAGPWQFEPDEVEWKDETTGLPCKIWRGPVGSYCGYVGVPSSHPWFGAGYSDLPDYGPEVHGGLTFAGESRGTAEGYWWFGFDCAHAGDYLPRKYGIASVDRPIAGDVYRDLDYVRSEVLSLAKQLADVSKP